MSTTQPDPGVEVRHEGMIESVSVSDSGVDRLKPGVRLVRCGLGRDPLPAMVLLRMWGNCFVGLSAYPVARRIAKARRERYAA